MRLVVHGGAERAAICPTFHTSMMKVAVCGNVMSPRVSINNLLPVRGNTLILMHRWTARDSGLMATVLISRYPLRTL